MEEVGEKSTIENSLKLISGSFFIMSAVCFRTGRIHTGRRGPGRKRTALINTKLFADNHEVQ